ncbi:MAG: hypothetical protein ACP5VP_11450 [Candidatus Limnocylindrales bacterium]
MKRLYVLLPTEAWEALVRASSRDLRHPSRQAAYILREALLGVSQVAHHPEEPAASVRGNQGRQELGR